MRAFALAPVVVLAVTGCAPPKGPPPPTTPDESEAFYGAGVLPHVDITLPQASLDALAVDPRAYASATLVVDGTTLENVGIRIKGEDNFRPLPDKSAFKIKLDEFVDGQELHGLTHITLNNVMEDPSFLSERLAYQAWRSLGLPAPRANNAVVTINGEPWGVYANVEAEDKTFLKRWFDDEDGNLYEEGGSDFVPGEERSFDKETNATADDWSDLQRLCSAVAAAGDDTFLDDISGVVDVDRFLTYSALEAVVEQWDGYSYTLFGPNNFRIYDDPTTKTFVLLPWGIDMSLKPYDGADLDVHAATGLLLTRCFASPSCTSRYDDTLRTVADDVDALDLATSARTYRDQIAADVANDPKTPFTEQQISDGFDLVVRTIGSRGDEVRSQLP